MPSPSPVLSFNLTPVFPSVHLSPSRDTFFFPRLVDPFTAFWSKRPLCRFKVTQQGYPGHLACLDMAGPLPSISRLLSLMPAELFSAELICFTCLRFLPCRTLSSVWIESLGFRRLAHLMSWHFLIFPEPAFTRLSSVPCLICWVLIPWAPGFLCSLFCEEKKSPGASGLLGSVQ